MASKIKTTALLWTFCWSMYKAFELSGLNVREMTQMDADTLETQYRNCAEQNKDVCSKLEYVTKLNMRQKISSLDVEKNRRIHEISTIDEATEYQTIFEDYILKNRPFMSPTQSSDAMHLVDFCDSPNQFTHDHSLRRCAKMEQFKDIHIPSILGNSYNLRLSDHSSQYNEAFNFGQDWPAILDVQNNNSVPIHKCPSRMHQVLWGQNDSMIVRLFLNNKASQLGQVFGTHYELLHHPVYTSDAFPQTTSSDFPKYAEVVLEKDHFMFVPETYLIGLGASASSADPVLCLRMCFVDASNLKVFKDELSLDAVLSPHSRKVLRQLNDPSQDLKMSRNPKDFSFRKMSAPDSAQELDSVTEEVTVDAEPQKKNQRRRKSSTGKFREWQDINKWNVMISSLTLPQPPVPTVKSLGRKNITLQWKSAYIPSALDKTSFGYNITICAEDVTDTQNCFVESFYRKSNSNVEEHTLIENTDNELSTKEGSEVVMSTIVLKDLDPGKSYKFQSTMLVGTAYSNPSEWTRIYTTHEVTYPSNILGPLEALVTNNERSLVTLWFNLPLDDGGLTILEYAVYKRNDDENFSTEWKHHTSVNSSLIMMTSRDDHSRDNKGRVSLVLTDLLPDCTYEFKVFVVNDKGKSKESIISNKILLQSTQKSFTSAHIVNGDRGDFGGFSAAILLNDTAQILSTLKKGSSIDVWSSYYSPKKFSVAGVPIFIKSPVSTLMDTTHGEDTFKGKIAILPRDGEPISTKAKYVQMAGAIGCVILDAGKCVDFDQKCFPGSHKNRGEYFGEVDPLKAWSSVRIPVVFALNNMESTNFFDSVGNQLTA